MEHLSLIPKGFFEGPKISDSVINCNVDFFVDDLQAPSNMCVKQLGGVAPAWCCKYDHTHSHGPVTKNVSKCWSTCPTWEAEATQLKI